jgi:uncharacterized protein (DUF849 family)
MAVKACLNGARRDDEHPAVPLTPSQLAADAVAVRDAGAFAVHVHPRDAAGRETMARSACDAAVAAIRAAAPKLPIGLSTSAGIDPDPFARATAVTSWTKRPDFVSVNLSEVGWAGIVRSALRVGIAVEAGLATPEDAEQLVDSPFAHQVLRALVEVDGGAQEAQAIAALIPRDIPQVWHGTDHRTWEVLQAAVSAGVDVRVGLEDVLVLPDGRATQGNAELVKTALLLAVDPQ